MKLIKKINKCEHQIFSEYHKNNGYKKSIETICSELDWYDKFNIVYERHGKAKFYLSKYWDNDDGRKINLKFVENLDFINIYVDDDLIDAPKEPTKEDLQYDEGCDGFAEDTNYMIVNRYIHDLLY
tara:strand:- start:202 stop:579 length:378 start_codon:yes stop_codon:yes gene_type:complete